jgi:hypothetical protein
VQGSNVLRDVWLVTRRSRKPLPPAKERPILPVGAEVVVKIREGKIPVRLCVGKRLDDGGYLGAVMTPPERDLEA